MTNSPHPDRKIGRQDVLSIFEEMGKACREEGAYYEIAIYGGSALMLSFDYREATFDIDFVPVSGAADKISDIANRAAMSLGFPQDLLRDDVSIFVSDAARYEVYGEFPKGEGNLRVFTATPEYIFSMKLLAMRNSMETHDMRDIWELADACNIDDAEAAISMLEKFYPGQALPIRNRLILEDVFEAKRQDKPYSPILGWQTCRT